MSQFPEMNKESECRYWPAACSVTLLSVICFNLLWLCLVVFRYQGILPAILLLALMLACKPQKLPVLWRAAWIAICGIIIDSLLSHAGIFIFPDSIMPLWLIVLWCGFALALPAAFGFILNWSLPMQSLAGALASLNYLAGQALGAVDYAWPLLHTQLLLALLWAGLLPFFCFLLTYRRSSDE